MIIDSNLLFGTFDVSQGSEEKAIANIVDTKVAGDAILDELYLHVRSYGKDKLTTLTDLEVKLETSDKAEMGDAVVILQAKTKVVDGRVAWWARMPAGAKRYLQVKVTCTPTEGCSGCIAAFLTHGPQHTYNDFTV